MFTESTGFFSFLHVDVWCQFVDILLHVYIYDVKIKCNQNEILRVYHYINKQKRIHDVNR
jgi:hypothetical protein